MWVFLFCFVSLCLGFCSVLFLCFVCGSFVGLFGFVLFVFLIRFPTSILFSLQAEEGDPSPLPSAGETHLECCAQSWALQYKRETGTLEQGLCRATEMMQGLKHQFYEERLRKLGLPSMEKSRLRESHPRV